MRAMNKLALRLIFIICTLPLAINHGQAQGDLLGRINGLRSSLGLAAYSLNPALAAAAQNHADYMATSGEVSHIQSSGSTPRDRAAAAGYGSSWVSENIYMGASLDTAWGFWTNSPVHYAALTSASYTEVGIGSSSGAIGTAYVIVFGNPQGLSVTVPGAGGSGGGGSESSAAAPSFIVGQDNWGNIMHEVQAGDTLGDIALIYGYTWDDIPGMLAINGLQEGDLLEIGSVFLVPPTGGTYTPTPGGSTPSPEATAEALPIQVATLTPSAPALLAPATFVAPSATPTRAIIVRPVGTITPTVAAVASVASSTGSGPPAWLLIAISVQVGVLLFATAEFIRRWRR